MVLLGGVANPLQDGLLEIVIHQEVLDGLLLDCYLGFPGQSLVEFASEAWAS